MTESHYEPCTITVFPSRPENVLEARIRSEYREMPAMRLTLEQAMRLWAIDRRTCADTLESLVAAHFLEKDHNGCYAKFHSGY